jgi:hypothetical protein
VDKNSRIGKNVQIINKQVWNETEVYALGEMV